MRESVASVFTVSSAVRSCGPGERCGDMAFVLPLDGGRAAIVVIASVLAVAISASLRHEGSPALALALCQPAFANV